MVDLARSLSHTLYAGYERRLLKEVMHYPRPKHVAVIMDGNRRYAQKMGLENAAGHIKGRGKLEQMLEWCLSLDIRVLTVYAFSTENLNRAPHELEALFELFERSFIEAGDDPRVHEHKIRIRALGRLKLLPDNLQKAIRYAEGKTAEYDQYFYNIAVAYGGREEILSAVRRIASDAVEGELDPKDIDEQTIASYLLTADLPDPDLILRTSGEERVSNFLLWQLAYAELYFTDVFWPAFRKVDFLRAIRSYQRRQRRFGT